MPIPLCLFPAENPLWLPPALRINSKSLSVSAWTLVMAWSFPLAPVSFLLSCLRHPDYYRTRKAKQFAGTLPLLPIHQRHTSEFLYKLFPVPGGSYPSSLTNQLLPCGENFPCPPFLVGNRLQPPWPSLSSKGQIQAFANQGREGMQRQGRGSQETIVQPWGRVLVPPQGIHITISLSSLQK